MLRTVRPNPAHNGLIMLALGGLAYYLAKGGALGAILPSGGSTTTPTPATPPVDLSRVSLSVLEDLDIDLRRVAEASDPIQVARDKQIAVNGDRVGVLISLDIADAVPGGVSITGVQKVSGTQYSGWVLPQDLAPLAGKLGVRRVDPNRVVAAG